MADDKPRKRIKQLEVMVADTIRETHDATTLVLFTGNDKLDYQPGHFLTIGPHQFAALERFTAYLEDVKEKKEPPRAYSLTSAPHEKYLAITVKEERYVSGAHAYPPLLSPLLVNRFPVGTRMVVTGFTGPYTMPADIEDRTDRLVHICAGSGSVPNLSIIKHAFANDMNLHHTLIYSNKYWRDVIFQKELEALHAQYPDRLKVIHALTREESAGRLGPNVHGGRVNLKLLQAHVPDPAGAEYFVCGPGITKWDKKKAREEGVEPGPRFLESVMADLQAMNVGSKSIHNESYG